MTGGLLAVHAHPDDETISTGALLATWAAAGRPVTVVTCTRGEEGEVIPPALRPLQGDGERLARHRERELAAALDALGVRDHAFLDGGEDAHRIVDSGMAWVASGRAGAADDVPEDALVSVPLDDAAGRLAGILLGRRPAVVATYEPGGGYGHPDHVRTHEVTMRAVELAAGAGLSRPVVLWSVLERGRWRAAVDEVRAAGVPDGLSVLDPAAGEPSAATDGDVDVRVAVAEVRDAVLAALAAHETQVQAVAPVDGVHAVGRFALSNDVVQPVLAHEAYVRGAGDLAAVEWPDGCVVGAT